MEGTTSTPAKKKCRVTPQVYNEFIKQIELKWVYLENSTTRRHRAPITAARAWCRAFFAWYNHQHYPSGIAYLRPADLHAQQHDGRDPREAPSRSRPGLHRAPRTIPAPTDTQHATRGNLDQPPRNLYWARDQLTRSSSCRP